VQRVFKNDQPAVPEGLLQPGGEGGIRYGSPGVEQKEQIPVIGAVVERFGRGLHGMDAHSRSARRFAGTRESLFRDVKTYIPTPLGQEDSAATLSHGDVRRLARPGGPNGLRQKRVVLPRYLPSLENAVKEYP
jgi:hypothetical protein